MKLDPLMPNRDRISKAVAHAAVPGPMIVTGRAGVSDEQLPETGGLDCGRGLFFPSTAFAQQIAASDSVWQNPANSVHVRVHACGASRCGTVVWANDKAKADSARGGTPNLVGTELFRDFHEVSPKVWKGKVFVPDLNRVFSGTGAVKDANALVARGCLTGNFGCKSKTWTRGSSTAP